MESRKIFENAQRLFLEGKLNESITLFSDAIESGEETEIAYLSRGVAYLKSKQINSAINDFGAVVTINDENVRAHYYRGIAYMSDNKFSEAISEFDRTIQLKPNNGAAFFARGTAYSQLGDEYQANKNMQTAITFSEADVYELQELIGLWQTQLDRAMMPKTDKGDLPTMGISEDEVKKVKK